MKKKPDFSELSAMYINCTLKNSSKQSHTEGLMQISIAILKAESVTVDYLPMAILVRNGMMVRDGIFIIQNTAKNLI